MFTQFFQLQMDDEVKVDPTCEIVEQGNLAPHTEPQPIEISITAVGDVLEQAHIVTSDNVVSEALPTTILDSSAPIASILDLRDPLLVPLKKLSVNLMKTYKHINEVLNFSIIPQKPFCIFVNICMHMFVWFVNI